MRKQTILLTDQSENFGEIEGDGGVYGCRDVEHGTSMFVVIAH